MFKVGVSKKLITKNKVNKKKSINSNKKRTHEEFFQFYKIEIIIKFYHLITIIK